MGGPKGSLGSQDNCRKWISQARHAACRSGDLCEKDHMECLSNDSHPRYISLKCGTRMCRRIQIQGQNECLFDIHSTSSIVTGLTLWYTTSSGQRDSSVYRFLRPGSSRVPRKFPYIP